MNRKYTSKKICQEYILLTNIILILSLLTACSPGSAELAATDFNPQPGDDWEVSTPAEEGLDPELVARAYLNAEDLETLYSLLVVKNDKLIAEKYFNDGALEKKTLMQSASKSYISALIGLALEQGCLESVDQKMLDFFPEYAADITDPRKEAITIRHLLQMRSGYPWEETHPDLMAAMWTGDNPPLVVSFPLTADPDTVFQYSNLSNAWLAAILSRACDTNLKDFSEEYLLEPMGVEMGELWPNEYDDYHALFHFRARDAAKFGLLYLNEGVLDGKQIFPTEWVRDSLKTYSEKVSTSGVDSGKIGRYFREVGYGYQWWSARAGEHYFNYAAGHGGQLIVLLEDLDMVIVTTAYPFFQQHDGGAWKHEKATINLVGKFIASLPQPE